MQEYSLCARGSGFKFPAPTIKLGVATYACDPSAVGERGRAIGVVYTHMHTHLTAHARVRTHNPIRAARSQG